ncbi:MAG: carboxypeptidase regulatory-like domain-containing protein, partial [Bacteroidota bacterium]
MMIRKRNYWKQTLWACAILMIVAGGCRQDDRMPFSPDLAEQETLVGKDLILGDKTQLLSPTAREQLVEVSEDQSMLSFSQPRGELNVVREGDILMIPPTPEAPYGLLRKVSEVQRDGENVHFVTTQANLTEAIQSGRIEANKDLRPADILIEELAEGVTRSDSTGRISGEGFFFSVEREFELPDGDQVFLEGSFSVKPNFYGNINFGFFSIETAEMGVNLNANADLSLTYGAGFEGTTGDFLLARYVFSPVMMGPVPVVPVLTLEAEIKGGVVVGISTSVDYEVTLRAGLVYREESGWDSNVQASGNGNANFGPSVQLSAEATLDPAFTFLIFGIAGPKIETLELGLEFEADPLQSPCWTIGLVTQVDFEVDFVILGERYEIIDDIELFSYRIKEWEGSCLNPGTLKGLVVEAVSEAPLAGVLVEVRNAGGSVVGSGQTDADGRYEFEVAAGEDMVATFSKLGYLNATYQNLTIEPFLPKTLDRLLSIDELFAGNGSFGGKVTDAFTGQGLAGVVLQVRSGNNNSSGQVLATTSTSISGFYQIANLPAGNYTVEATKVGYISDYFFAICLGNRTTGQQNGSLTPELPNDEVRIVLTWGATPSDLDSHLTGPLEGGNRFHVYWLNRNPSGAQANLDVDDITSFGPETITILEQSPGVYRYSIHNFSNLNETNSSALAYSGARVRVFFGSTEIADQVEHSLRLRRQADQQDIDPRVRPRGRGQRHAE